MRRKKTKRKHLIRQTPPKAELIWQKSNGRCWYCGVQMLILKNEPDSEKCVETIYPPEQVALMFTLDHVIPLKDGGSKEIGNLVGSCRRCNNQKADGSIDYLRMRLLMKQHGWPTFNNQQYLFLFERGINLGKLMPFKFYFETHNLS